MSERILLSGRHFHYLRLSEQEIGLIIDALQRLTIPDLDSEEYAQLVKLTVEKLNQSLEQPVSHSTVPVSEQREWEEFKERVLGYFPDTTCAKCCSPIISSQEHQC